MELALCTNQVTGVMPASRALVGLPLLAVAAASRPTTAATTALVAYDPSAVITPYDVRERQYNFSTVGLITMRQAGAAGLASSLSTVMWDAGYALARHLDAVDASELDGARVVELGAGLGLPSIVASLRGAARAIATDGDPQCLPLLLENAQQAGAATVRAHPLDWANAREALSLNDGRLFDLVLAADVVYAGNAGAWRPLLNALAALAAPGATVLLAQTIRTGGAAEAFLRLARRRRFEVETLDDAVDASGKVQVHRLRSPNSRQTSSET